MTRLFMRNSLFIAIVAISMLSHARSTKEIQVLISPQQEGFFFGLNNGDGNGIITDPFAERSFGSSYILNGFIFPQGTISKNQENFNVDRHGNELPREIGTFYAIANVTEDLAFTPQGFPDQGTVVELVTWQFDFRKECNHSENTIIAMGKVEAGEIESDRDNRNPIGFRAEDIPVVSTTGCNFAVPNTIVSAKAYLSPEGQMLLVVKFKHDIEYKDQ